MSYFGAPWHYPQRYDVGRWFYETKTITTNHTTPLPGRPVPSDEDIRRIVREEIAELPIPFDVPDAPPEP